MVPNANWQEMSKAFDGSTTAETPRRRKLFHLGKNRLSALEDLAGEIVLEINSLIPFLKKSGNLFRLYESSRLQYCQC